MSTNTLQLTHEFKKKNNEIIKIDIRPEAIKLSNNQVKDFLEGKSSGDNVIWEDGEHGVFLGVTEKRDAVFANKEHRVFRVPAHFVGTPLLFLKTPKTKIEWHSEPKPEVKISKKRKNVEIELASDEEMGEIKFVKKIAKTNNDDKK
jgi:hypothetical protein